MNRMIILMFGVVMFTNACGSNNVQPWTFDGQSDLESKKDMLASEFGPDVAIENDRNAMDSSDMFVGKMCDASPEVWFSPDKRNLEQLVSCERSLSPLSFVDYYEEFIPLRFIESLSELGPEAGLTIYRNPNLLNLDGFANLEKIGRGLRLSNADFLADINGLENLRSIGTKLEITAIPITTLDGLKNLEFIGGDFDIYASSELRSLEGLQSLRKIEGDVLVAIEGMTDDQFRAFVERVEIGGAINFQGEAWPRN